MNKTFIYRHSMLLFSIASIFVFSISCSNRQTVDPSYIYSLETGSVSRSISFENPTGEPGAGGITSSNLGAGRKGSPAKEIEPGETVTLCDIEGPGTVRHIWMTGSFKDHKIALREMVIRAYWENQDYPSIECPLGDFMGSANARYSAYQSEVHSTGENAAFNIWLPMPFLEKGKITLSNEGDEAITVFYQVDYTIGDTHSLNTGRLHVCFLRENPTTRGKDFEIFPARKGKGRYIGSVMGIRTLDDYWWGEGEIKIYMDGDTDFPTICGTGSEDYVCLSYGMQETQFLYHGCSWNKEGLVSMYRWHILDPVYWNKECRITIQQIGYNWDNSQEGKAPLYERQDDWSCATFWYESIPSDPLPELPGLEGRIANL